MPRVRSYEQSTRKFLSFAFRHDTNECQGLRPVVASLALASIPNPGIVRLDWAAVEGSLAAQATALQVSFFDVNRRTFFGSTHRLLVRNGVISLDPTMLPPRNIFSPLAEPHASSSSVFWAPIEAHINCCFEILASRQDSQENDNNDGRRSRESVLAWGIVPITSLPMVEELELRTGSAQLLFLERAQWPPTPIPSQDKIRLKVSTINASSFQAAGNVMAAFANMVPAGVVAPSSFLPALTATSSVEQRNPVGSLFRVVLHQFEVQQQSVTAATTTNTTNNNQSVVFAQDTIYSVVAIGHSGYRPLCAAAESELEMTNVDTLTARRDIELSGLPQTDPLLTAATAHVVFALRARKKNDMVGTVIGFVVLPLRPLSDRDVTVGGLPCLRGPFSCDDARMVGLEVDSPFATLPVRASVTVQYFSTPVAARTVEEVIQPKLRRPEQKPVEAILAPAAQSPGLPLAGGSAVAAIAAVDAQLPSKGDAHEGVVPTKPDSHASPTTGSPPLLVTAQGTATTSSPTTQVASPSPAAAAAPSAALSTQQDIAAYRLLCSIMEELERIKDAQQKMHMRLLASPSPALGVRAAADGSPSSQLTSSTQNACVELVDLAPRRAAISFATRCAMLEGMQPLLHPVSGLPMSHGMIATERLINSLLGIRIEGLTVDSNSELMSSVPSRLVAFMSFGSLPLQSLAVMHTQPVVEDGGWRTLRIAAKSDTKGFTWCEPIFDSRQDNFTESFKANGTLYIHFYDAVRMFYLFTATIQMATFARPIEHEVWTTSLDVALSKDWSLTEKVLPAKVMPIIANVGQLHVTLFSVGVQVKGDNRGKGELADKQREALTTRHDPFSPKHGNIVVAKKIPNLDFTAGTATAGGPVNKGTTPSPSPIPAIVFPSTIEANKQRVHQQRAQYVKDLIQKNGGAIPGVPAKHLQQRDDMELEYRLRFVEKKRDEMKAAAIAEVLRSRITKEVHVTIATGRSESCEVLFENPFGETTAFTVNVAELSTKYLKVNPAFNACFTVGPRALQVVPFMIFFDEIPMGAVEKGSTTHLQASIRSRDRGELLLIADIHVTFVPPTIHRRYEVYGAAGTEVTKVIFAQNFASASLPKIDNAAECNAKLSALCSFVTSNDPLTTASSTAVVDALTQTFAVAWEEVTVKALIPVEGSRTALVHLYRDSLCTRHWETWELTIFPCIVVTVHSLYYGRTTTIPIPVEGERLYSDDTQIEIPPPAVKGTTTNRGALSVRFKPRDVGSCRMLLHALRGDVFDKVLLVTSTAYPAPTFEQTIELSAADTQMPLFRRLNFVNREAQQRVFHVQHNYRSHVTVTPKTFVLGPGDSQHLSIEVAHLQLMDGQQEGRWPLWIFVNDQDDGTVESYFLQVVVRLHRPFF